ncbi:PH domain-containing protein [Corynebacterium pseudopelargi]|uniref:Low molecular weight protein antigen 6 PH domain-containing protein n=1 Tax=Corynebacterium pseudopelargi TaxID=2080757 RepID=A0A3G6IU57_9CORY|nr:PH domain-containing protein [Corynebacterium pseudopelargi]AZA09206.1 hypothetical protein CPPEL_05430 [Corynebacterium pseudopelargi]
MSDVENLSNRRLSDEELQRYVAADAALTSNKPWTLTIVSRKMRLWAIIAATVIVLLHVFLAIVVAIGDTGTTVTVIDQWGYFLVGVLLAAIVFIALWRPRVQANEDGVEVRNFLGTKFYPWVVIYGLNFPEGAKMARLELPDFEYVALWALQASDGAQAVADVQAFRALEARYMPED